MNVQLRNSNGYPGHVLNSFGSRRRRGFGATPGYTPAQLQRRPSRLQFRMGRERRALCVDGITEARERLRTTHFRAYASRDHGRNEYRYPECGGIARSASSSQSRSGSFSSGGGAERLRRHERGSQ